MSGSLLMPSGTLNKGSSGGPRLRGTLSTNAVTAFFTFTQKPPQLVTPIDVKTWQAALEDQGLAPASVYAKVSRVSSWFRWALEDETLRETLHANPVALARPKAYQNESAQALTDDEARELLLGQRSE